jgi:hypothetical protein
LSMVEPENAPGQRHLSSVRMISAVMVTRLTKMYMHLSTCTHLRGRRPESCVRHLFGLVGVYDPSLPKLGEEMRLRGLGTRPAALIIYPVPQSLRTQMRFRSAVCFSWCDHFLSAGAGDFLGSECGKVLLTLCPGAAKNELTAATVLVHSLGVASGLCRQGQIKQHDLRIINYREKDSVPIVWPGLGHRSFTAATRVQISLGTLYYINDMRGSRDTGFVP